MNSHFWEWSMSRWGLHLVVMQTVKRYLPRTGTWNNISWVLSAVTFGKIESLGLLIGHNSNMFDYYVRSC